jgi:hypothetical protein
MREIKFRGKWIVDNQWVYGGFFMRRLTSSPTIATDSGMWLPVHPETVGQYTGEKDYNETKIHEDDIGLIDGYRYRVIFYKCRWSFQLLVGNHTIYPPNFYEHTKNFKIIGNAFDNPELLEEVDDSH